MDVLHDTHHVFGVVSSQPLRQDHVHSVYEQIGDGSGIHRSDGTGFDCCGDQFLHIFQVGIDRIIMEMTLVKLLIPTHFNHEKARQIGLIPKHLHMLHENR